MTKRVLKPEHKNLLRELYYGENFYMGRDKLFALVREHFPDDHPSRRAILHDFLEKQEVYQLFVRPVTKLKGTKPVSVTKAMKYWQCDLHSVENIQERGYKYLFGIVDVLSSMFYVKPMKRKTAEETAKVFGEILLEHPEIDISVMQSDNGVR